MSPGTEVQQKEQYPLPPIPYTATVLKPGAVNLTGMGVDVDLGYCPPSLQQLIVFLMRRYKPRDGTPVAVTYLVGAVPNLHVLRRALQ